MPEKTRRFVLTGGPGAGKTSVIDALATRGHRTTVEAGRAIIAACAQAGLPPPWIDPVHYAELMRDHDIAEYDAVANHAGNVFFDRGVPDLLGYLALMRQTAPAGIREAAFFYRYEPTVFIFPPWREIYRQDTERHQDFTEAVRTHDMMMTAYQDLGYSLIEVPPASIAARVDFILAATIE